MKFKKVIKEAAIEIVGTGTNEKVLVNIGGKSADMIDLRSQAPMSYKAIIKAARYAKNKGFDFSKNKQPADITLMGDGSIIIVDDSSNKKLRIEPIQIGFDDKMISTLKAEISK